MDPLLALRSLVQAIENGRQWQKPADIVECWVDIAKDVLTEHQEELDLMDKYAFELVGANPHD